MSWKIGSGLHGRVTRAVDYDQTHQCCVSYNDGRVTDFRLEAEHRLLKNMILIIGAEVGQTYLYYYFWIFLHDLGKLNLQYRRRYEEGFLFKRLERCIFSMLARNKLNLNSVL